MASKIQMEKFNKRVEKIVLGLGGIPTPNDIYKWAIKTKAGKLSITVHEAQASELFSIFCCFDDHLLANEMLGENNKGNFNENSGKWNFHVSSEEECLQRFTYKLRLIEVETELAHLYDLRIHFGGVTIEERISRAIRDCFNRHKGKLSKALMDETIKVVGRHTPQYKKMWKEFKVTFEIKFEIKTKGGEYINPYYID